MARSRTLKPEFWTDSRIVKLSPFARLFYQGMWNFALCDFGHLDDDPDSLKLKILPVDPVDPYELVEELIANERVIRRTTPEGRSYLRVPTLDKHSKMDTRWATRCPYCALEGTAKPAAPPASTQEHAETHTNSDEYAETQPSKGKERKGKEGVSGDATSPRAKPRHKIPDDFAITAEMIAWAREHTPLVGQRDTDAFIDHWRGNGEVKANWNATWRNWMRRAQTNAEHYRSRASPPPPPAQSPSLQLFNPDDHD